MTKPATKITDEHRRFIVERLARFDTSTDVQAALLERFGIRLALNSINYYDPTKSNSRTLAEKWRALFKAARDHFLTYTETHVPEANRSVRLQLLAESARVLRQRGNHVAAVAVLKQIAEEMGDVYTNRRELSGRNGKPLEMNVSTLTEEQIRARVTQLVGASTAALLLDGQGPDLERPRPN